MVEFNNSRDKVLEKNIEKVHNQIALLFSLPENFKVSVNFVGEEEIRNLNNSTRGIDSVTDVLTYPYIDIKAGEKLDVSKYSLDIDPEDGKLLIGDIYICLPRARAQAKEFAHGLVREVSFLFCHGMLHILGYDHIDKKDALVMEPLQEKIMSACGIGRDISFKSGFVTLVGETNTGKSTLINALVGEHVSIVTPKTQTTRENIKGIYNDAESQIVFVDTPGYHKRATKVDDEMDKQIGEATADTEIILMMIDAKKQLLPQYDALAKKVSSTAKKILLINKIDERSYEALYPQLAILNTSAQVDEILPISAKTGRNLDVLIEMIKKYLPTYNFEMRYYPVDEYTDKNLRHMVAEIIREKALLFLDDEVPHGVYVETTQYLEDAEPIQISADVYCEKENHKAIILGKGGEMIKKISTASRKSIEYVIGQHVNLELFVKVKPNWRNNIKDIEAFGLNVSE